MKLFKSAKVKKGEKTTSKSNHWRSRSTTAPCRAPGCLPEGGKRRCTSQTPLRLGPTHDLAPTEPLRLGHTWGHK